MELTNFLKNFKYKSLIEQQEESKDGSTLTYTLNVDSSQQGVMDCESETITFSELSLAFSKKDNGMIDIDGSLDLIIETSSLEECENDDEDDCECSYCMESLPCDEYQDELEPLFNALKECLEENYVVDLSMSLATESMVVSGVLKADKSKMKITDFDYIHDDDENQEGAMTKEEVIALIESYGGFLKEYVKHGVGGGNPQFIIYLPEEKDERPFFMDLYKLTEEDMKGGTFEDVF